MFQKAANRLKRRMSLEPPPDRAVAGDLTLRGFHFLYMKADSCQGAAVA